MESEIAYKCKLLDSDNTLYDIDLFEHFSLLELEIGLTNK